MSIPLEDIYRAHHATNRGDDFVLLGQERGAFLREQIGTGKQVIDLGCRDGALTRSYATGNTVLGVDIDGHALERAREGLDIQVMQMDLNGAWDLPKGAADVAVACEVVEHLYYPEQVLDKARELLKPGGVFVGSVPNAFSLKHRVRYLRAQKKHTPLSDPTHINHFTVAELTQLLERSFIDVRVYGLGRYARLARRWPQQFAFDLLWTARRGL